MVTGLQDTLVVKRRDLPCPRAAIATRGMAGPLGKGGREDIQLALKDPKLSASKQVFMSAIKASFVCLFFGSIR